LGTIGAPEEGVVVVVVAVAVGESKGFFVSPMLGKSIGPSGSEYSGNTARKRGCPLFISTS
jgi:hypothetical protein